MPCKRVTNMRRVSRRHEKIRVCCCFFGISSQISGFEIVLNFREGNLLKTGNEMDLRLHFFSVADVANKIPAFLHDFVADFVV